MKSKDMLIVKKLPNLGWDENFNYEDHDVLYIENPNIFSEKTFEKIKNIKAIIHASTTTPSSLPEIPLIKKSDLNIIERTDFIMIDKKELENKLKSADVIYKIIDDYKKERMRTLASC